jgi:hypothetical protein
MKRDGDCEASSAFASRLNQESQRAASAMTIAMTTTNVSTQPKLS